MAVNGLRDGNLMPLTNISLDAILSITGKHIIFLCVKRYIIY